MKNDTTQQHTPGPWRTNTDEDGRHHALPILAPFEVDDGSPYHPLIAQVLHGRGAAPREIAEANARLIASAPALAHCDGGSSHD